MCGMGNNNETLEIGRSSGGGHNGVVVCEKKISNWVKWYVTVIHYLSKLVILILSSCYFPYFYAMTLLS